MVRKVWYEAIEPYYTDCVQAFIGATWEDLDNQEYEHDRWLGREHPAGIRFIYDKHTIYESDCSDYEKEIHETYYQKYLQKNKSREGD